MVEAKIGDARWRNVTSVDVTTVDITLVDGKVISIGCDCWSRDRVGRQCVFAARAASNARRRGALCNSVHGLSSRGEWIEGSVT